jgi:GT2 family glycosyltransferase
MNGLSILTLVRNREDHLHQLVEGLRRSRRRPDELIIVDMSDRPVENPSTPFPVRIARVETDSLPLAAARNRAARAARHPHLLFLDVDCIPMADCLGRLDDELAMHDALLCADIRYLGPDDARGGWLEPELMASGIPHATRRFPARGVRQEADAGLFWSLAFAIRADRFAALGGFDEEFTGYGAEDTDFGFRAAAAGLPLLFVGGAIACHQHHESHDPPVQHLRDIVANAWRFRERWHRWPMEGWLGAFAAMGLVDWSDDRLDVIRSPTASEMETTKVGRAGELRNSTLMDRPAGMTVDAA